MVREGPVGGQSMIKAEDIATSSSSVGVGQAENRVIGCITGECCRVCVWATLRVLCEEFGDPPPA